MISGNHHKFHFHLINYQKHDDVTFVGVDNNVFIHLENKFHMPGHLMHYSTSL